MYRITTIPNTRGALTVQPPSGLPTIVGPRYAAEAVRYLLAVPGWWAWRDTAGLLECLLTEGEFAT